jgi:hypothetical protein
MSVVGSILRQIEQDKISSVDALGMFTPLCHAMMTLILGPGEFVAFQNWTLVDLSVRVVTASFLILSALIPKKWKTSDGSTNRTTPGRSPYIRSTGRTSISGKREVSESEESIVRTDEVELSFKTRSQYFRERNHQAVLSNGSVGRINEAEANSNEFVMGLSQR